MLNITLISLNIFSLLSISPFYSIQNSNKLPQTLILNSHFSHSFNNIIASYTSNHRTYIKNSIFSFTLESAVKFSNNIINNKLIQYNANCTFDANSPIGGQIINGEMFGNDEHHSVFLHDCGDIIITGCIFNNCYSNEPGGSIIILQNCSATIHNTIFNCSHTKNITGGAVFAAGSIDKDTHNFDNDKIIKLDIQYCCFQNCYGDADSNDISPLYGIAVFSSAINNILYYASTVHCPGPNRKATGAQFDLQGTNVSSKYVNSTGGNSKYCGGIEYRHPSNGFFRFQTISDSICMFSVSYTNILSQKVDLSLSNIVNVTLKYGFPADERVRSALIHIRQTKTIILSNFSFIDNIMEDEPFTHHDKTLIDHKMVFSRGYFDKDIEYVDISIDNCYYNCHSNQVIDTTNAYVRTFNVIGNANIDDLNHIQQLDLGDCKGEVKAKPLTPTYKFSDSHYFTNSKVFTNSKEFSKTNEFSLSDEFSQSVGFTKSKAFTDSAVFTNSKAFTNSDVFTQLTFSEEFSSSLSFTSSNRFSHSNAFSASSIDVKIGVDDTDNKSKVNVGMIAGIVSGVAAASAAAAVAAFFLIKKKGVGAPVEIETITNSQGPMNNENPLYDKEAQDDPFKDDFA